MLGSTSDSCTRHAKNKKSVEITDMKITAGAWVVVYCPKKRSFLLGKRSGRVNNPKRWNLFGGRLDPGESPVDAALRELREESGIRATKNELKKLKKRRIHCTSSRSRPRELHFFLLTADKELTPRLNKEHTNYGWFRAGSIPSTVNRPTDIALRNGLLAECASIAIG